VLSKLKAEQNLFIPHRDLMPSLGVILSEFPDEPYPLKTRMMGLSDGEDRVILAWLV